MKADSGSWLYIILSIVFLVLTALGNKNKKKATTSTQPVNDEDDYEPTPTTQSPHAPARTWPKSLEDVLSEVLDGPKRPEVVYERPQPVRETILESTQNSYERIEEEAQSLETISEEVFTYESIGSDKKRVEYVESPITNNKTEESEPVLAFNNLDLRQGIIYSEILNRKYF
jgi:hypothetical protein